MGKKIFVLIVVLMSISLIGIVSVQLYWINNAIESKEIQFKSDVKKALARVSERLEVKEQNLYYNKIESFIKTKRFLNKAQIKNFLIQQIDTTTKSRFSFGTTVIEEDFKIPVLDILDKKYTSMSEILEIPLFYDSPQIRGVLDDIKDSRDAILIAANQLGRIEDFEIEEME